METEPTLASLAQSAASVYLDNCILSADRNRGEYNGQNSRGSATTHLAKILGKAWRFSDVRYPLLARQAQQSAGIRSAIDENSTIRTISAVMKEHTSYIAHLHYNLRYLREHSVRKKMPGCKESTLTHIIEEHELIHEALQQRLPCYENRSRKLASYLASREYHRSPDGLFMKKKGKNGKKGEASPADCQLVGEALLQAAKSSSEVAIVSADIDIINLLRNVAIQSGKRALPAMFPPATARVSVYFPSDENWVPGLGLKLMCNSRGDYSERHK